MTPKEIFEKITSKKEFSHLPKKDVERVFEKFKKRQIIDEEKIKFSRDLLRKVYSSFASRKLMNLKDKDEEWILRKHLSTRERMKNYLEIYSRILKDFDNKDISIIDLGSGINGFSYKYLPKKINYVGVEAVGQLVDLMNFYFKKNNFSGKSFHESLFELENIKKIISETKKPRVVFLFKVLDSLEMLEKNYSKELLKEIFPLCERIIISFATRSFVKREKFKVSRKWILDFLNENFEILDDFEISGERYLVVKNR